MDDKFQYMLAPLEDFTDSSFRSICPDVDLTFTELVRIDGLARGNNVSVNRTKLYDETPTQIQILGHKEKAFAKFLEDFKPGPGFKGFNLNLGCPAPNFVNKGIGCAMIKRVSKVKRIVELIKSYGHSVSIKMRLGLNHYEKKKKVYLNLINEVDADFFIVHARHGKETYASEPDWTVYEECVATGKNIIANGNIKTKEDVEKVKMCKGVMIGRAAISNPLIFSELKGITPKPLDEVMKKYDKLAKERNAHPKYSKNIKKYLKKIN